MVLDSSLVSVEEEKMIKYTTPVATVLLSQMTLLYMSARAIATPNKISVVFAHGTLIFSVLAILKQRTMYILIFLSFKKKEFRL